MVFLYSYIYSYIYRYILITYNDEYYVLNIENDIKNDSKRS